MDPPLTEGEEITARVSGGPARFGVTLGDVGEAPGPQRAAEAQTPPGPQTV